MYQACQFPHVCTSCQCPVMCKLTEDFPWKFISGSDWHSGCMRNGLSLNLGRSVLLMVESSVMEKKKKKRHKRVTDISSHFHCTGTEEVALLARDAYRSNRGLLASRVMFNVFSTLVPWGRRAAGAVRVE